jgi:hypothetical protein
VIGSILQRAVTAILFFYDFPTRSSDNFPSNAFMLAFFFHHQKSVKWQPVVQSLQLQVLLSENYVFKLHNKENEHLMPYTKRQLIFFVH